MRITFNELTSSHIISDIPINHQHNLEDLLTKINLVRTAYSHPMIVTSGYRSQQDHLRIYSQIAARKGEEFDPKKVPMGSAHLKGCAVDIADPKGELMAWCLSNVEILEQAGLWVEADTVGWVHFQIYPPRSGNRFFKP